MKPIDDVFMLDIEATLDRNILDAISISGFSRVPLFSGRRKNIVAVLLVKKLANVDVDKKPKIRSIMDEVCVPYLIIHFDAPLFELFNQFKRGTGMH